MASSNAITKIREIAESTLGPREALLSAVGKVDKVLTAKVLVATYIMPARTKGGIIRIDSTIQESEFQGSVGLVIGLGPGAFKDDNIAKFNGVVPKLHDFVLYRPADGLALEIKQVPCRLFEDVDIKMIIQNPQDYW